MSSDPQQLALRIDGQQTATDTSLADWPAEVFAIDGLARGATGEAATIPVPENAVLELELASGECLLVAAADAGRYLGTQPGRGGDKAADLVVGPALRFDGVRPPPGLARDGLGAWVVKSLSVYKQGPSAMTALIAAGTFQDAQLNDRNGLYRCAGEAFALTKVDALPVVAEPTLLFIHGTASSTEGSFGDLWRNENYRQKMVAAYGQRIYAFEHRSLTESPIDNALALVRTLPQGARLHLVSHSRGGMVGELLARANRVGEEPITEEEIEHFLKQAERGERDGFASQAEALREFNRELIKRAIRVERFVRVACPARGTTLASGRLDRWASVMLNLLGKGVETVGGLVPALAMAPVVYGLLKRFLLAVVKQRCDARVLPGLEAMMPDSPLVALLCAPAVKIDAKLHVIAGDFDGQGLLPWLGDCVSEVFYGGETDLVVNTPSMAGGAERSQGIFQKPVCGPQVTHFTYFERDESALALLAALSGDDSNFTFLPTPSQAVIARGGKKIKEKQDAPIVFLLPGIMGSHIQLGTDRIWFDPVSMVAGGMERLRIGTPDISSDGWLDMKYESLARYLADSHELRPFAYDWRISIVDEAKRFGDALGIALDDAEQRGKPLRIVAHSMGGLVARLALSTRWERFKKNPGNRLLLLGTPNQGSHAIAAVLMGRDDFVQSIGRFFDWKHDMRDFLEIVRDFPGVLELLPWPGEDGKAGDGVDYFNAGQWQSWYDQDTDPKKEKTWLPPLDKPLTAARKAIAAIQACPLDPERTIYVAGRAPTPCALRLNDGRVEIGLSDEGDGRVLWKTGVPPGVGVWYADAAHGDLADYDAAFSSFRDLLENGSTSEGALKRLPPAVRSAAATTFRARSLEGNALYPSVEEVLTAALGGAQQGLHRQAPSETVAEICVYHGSLASADAPVLVGAYANDSLRGSVEFLDAHLGGQLAGSQKIGRYPGQLREARVFFHPEKNARPAGAIVVGLGPIGGLMPGELTRTLSNGLLEYAHSAALHRCQPEAGSSSGLEVSALLVGTGFTGLTVEVGVRCLAEALRDANVKLASAGVSERVTRLSIFEETEERALSAVKALGEVVRDTRFTALRFDGRLRTASGGYRGRSAASGGKSGCYRVLIAADQTDQELRFTVISDRARNEVVAEPDQRQAVDGLIAAAIGGITDSPRLSCALFQLMVPNAFKAVITELRTLMLSVDTTAAAYPWELMRDTSTTDIPPLAARIELVRQLSTVHGRLRPPTDTVNRAFVLGDTRSHLPELPGAQQEARLVGATFREHGVEADILVQADARQVFESLLCGNYRFLHLAGHGEIKDKDTGHTGMVLGPDTFLTAAQIAKLPYVPEFVFINCCHLGNMAPDVERQRRWGELAANLATEFIEIGCKAVVAAGWEVDDAAADTFARSFYAAMLDGKRFGQALLIARATTYAEHPTGNTWGAFQAYGDERYSFPEVEASEEEDEIAPLSSHLAADLEMIVARLQGAVAADQQDYYRKRLTAIELAARNPECRTAAIAEKLGDAWAALGDFERAIAHYRSALDAEIAGASLRMVEQLANLEIRHGAKLAEAAGKVCSETEREVAQQYMEQGRARLDLLCSLALTCERLSLLGSYWKRRAKIASVLKSDGKEIDSCLREMYFAYWRAAEHAYQQTGEWDYYPLFNALDGAILLALRGDYAQLDALQPISATKHISPGQRRKVAKLDKANPVTLTSGLAFNLEDLLAAGSANAQRRFADKREFFHALAPVEAKRISALAESIRALRENRLTSDNFLDFLIKEYQDTLRCHGTAREHDSVSVQPKFLLALLPDTEDVWLVASALRRLIAGLEK